MSKFKSTGKHDLSSFLTESEVTKRIFDDSFSLSKRNPKINTFNIRWTRNRRTFPLYIQSSTLATDEGLYRNEIRIKSSIEPLVNLLPIAGLMAIFVININHLYMVAYLIASIILNVIMYLNINQEGLYINKILNSAVHNPHRDLI